MRLSGVSMTSEKAPLTCDTDSTMASSAVAAVDRAYRWSTTSVSLLVWKMAPCRTMASRSSPALTRLPLWHSAICPCAQSISIGWALTTRLSPKVEYRTWPIAVRPGSFSSTSSLKMSPT